MKPKIIWLSLLILAATRSVHGQSHTDHQLRLLLHMQAIDSGSSVGLATWGVIPNAMQQGPLRALFVGGVLFKKDGANWCEVMGGTFATTARVDPVLNVRTLTTLVGTTVQYAEILYSFRERKLSVLPNVTAAILVPSVPLRVGIESDVIFTHDKPPSYGVGPRLALPLKIFKGTSVTVGYQFTNGAKNLIRIYALLNI